MSVEIDPIDLEDENRKLRAEVRALLHQRDELLEELKPLRWFVRQWAAVGAAVENMRGHHAALYAAEKRRPLATLPVAAPEVDP